MHPTVISTDRRSDPRTTAIQAGRLVDPEAGTATPDAVILVEDGRFTAVGTGVEIPPGAEVIDLSDLTVLPGLADAHNLHHCRALHVAGLPLHHADPFDRLLIARARLEDVPVLPADSAFGEYEVEVVKT